MNVNSNNKKKKKTGIIIIYEHASGFICRIYSYAHSGKRRRHTLHALVHSDVDTKDCARVVGAENTKLMISRQACCSFIANYNIQ